MNEHVALTLIMHKPQPKTEDRISIGYKLKGPDGNNYGAFMSISMTSNKKTIDEAFHSVLNAGLMAYRNLLEETMLQEEKDAKK